MSLRDTVESVRRYPGMWLPGARYDVYEAFFIGVDHASSGGSLTGFREFLQLRLGLVSNLTWGGIVSQIALGEARRPVNEEEESRAAGVLLDLLSEFFAEVAAPSGRERLFHEWTLWLQTRDSADTRKDLIRHLCSPPPETVSVEEAANQLGIDRSALFGLIADGSLRTSRVLCELTVDRRSLDALRESRPVRPSG